MLDVGTDEVRLFLHLLAASIWVGGQLVLAGLVHPLRALSPDAPAAAANAFARIAWPAYAVLVLTGIWNIAAVDGTVATGSTAASWCSSSSSWRCPAPLRWPTHARGPAEGWQSSGR